MRFTWVVLGIMVLSGLTRHYLDGWSIRDSDFEELGLATVLLLMRTVYLLDRIARSITTREVKSREGSRLSR